MGGWKKHNRYIPKKDSRVPADQNFNEGVNQGFTLADYLREPFKWSYALNLPSEIRIAMISYIQFFRDFMQYTEDVDVELRTYNEGKKLRVEFLIENGEGQQFVQEKFRDYLANQTKTAFQLEVGLRSKIPSKEERDLFILRYEHQIENLKRELEYVQGSLEERIKHGKELFDAERKKNEQLLFLIEHWKQSSVETGLPILQEKRGEMNSQEELIMAKLVAIKLEILLIFKGHSENYCSIYTMKKTSIKHDELFSLTLKTILEKLNVGEEKILLQINQSCLINPQHAFFQKVEHQKWKVTFPHFPQIEKRLQEEIGSKNLIFKGNYFKQARQDYPLRFKE